MLISLQMKHSDTISHKGRIVEITPDTTIVEILCESACASCHARGLCSGSEASLKRVEVPSDPLSDYAPGDEVELVMTTRMGLKSVFIAYVIPLVIMVAVVLIMLEAGCSDLVSGISGIASILVYRLIIYLFRGTLRKEITFKLKGRI